METTVHQQLKRMYADGVENTEVVLGAYRIDAIRDDELIEIQFSSLSAISRKSQDLLQRHKLRVVKPIVARTRIAKIKRKGAPISSRRMSPKRGNVLELFEDLIYFTKVFPHPNLTLEVPMICVEQVRGPATKKRRRRGKDYKVYDVSLESVQETHLFTEPSDLLDLIPWGSQPVSFDTADIATAIDRPRWFAQQVAYVLRKVGAIESLERKRTGIIYQAKAA